MPSSVHHSMPLCMFDICNRQFLAELPGLWRLLFLPKKTVSFSLFATLMCVFIFRYHTSAHLCTDRVKRWAGCMCLVYCMAARYAI